MGCFWMYQKTDNTQLLTDSVYGTGIVPISLSVGRGAAQLPQVGVRWLEGTIISLDQRMRERGCIIIVNFPEFPIAPCRLRIKSCEIVWGGFEKNFFLIILKRSDIVLFVPFLYPV